jgi:hypothetical protein
MQAMLRPTGRVRASVVCYHCGHQSGYVEGRADAPLATGEFVREGDERRTPVEGRSVRCVRCGGPTYFDDVTPVRERQPRMVTWRGRGRPPKNAIRIELPPEAGAKRRRPVVLYAVMDEGT